MAILSNLVVNGAARCLNKLYCGDLQVAGSSTFGAITTTGLTVNGNASVTGTSTLKTTNVTGTMTIINTTSNNVNTVGLLIGNSGTGKQTRYMIDGMQAWGGTAVSSLYFNYWGGTVYLSNGTAIYANNGTMHATTFTGTSAKYDKVESNIGIFDELRSTHHEIEHVANLGGVFLVTPTVKCISSGNGKTLNSVTVTATSVTRTNSNNESVTYNYALAIDDSAFSTATIGSATWGQYGEVKVSGTLNGVVLGTCDGFIQSINVSSHVLNVAIKYDGTQTPATVSSTNISTVKDLNVMLCTVYTNNVHNPVGIWMKSRDNNGYSHISLYGGTSVNPIVRIGNLQGLPAVNGVSPDDLDDKWGIYTSNGFFSGTIVSSNGKIGDFNLTDKLYTGSHSTWNHASNGIYIASDGIAGGNGGTWYLWNNGTGKIGKYTFASNGALTTGTGSTQAGMGGTYAFWAGSSTQASAPFRVAYDGAFTSTSGTIGNWSIGTSGLYTNSKTSADSINTGILIQKDGNIYAGAYSSSTGACAFQLLANGSGKIGRYSFATNGEFTTTVNDNTAGMGNENYAFWAGAASSSAASAPFRVAYDGSAVFVNATLGDPDGYHVNIDSDSVDIMAEQTTFASFGEETVIGRTSGRHIVQNVDGIIFINDIGNEIFSVRAYEKTPINVSENRKINYKQYYNSATGTLSIINGTPISSITLLVYYPDKTSPASSAWTESFSFTYGTSASFTHTPTNNTNIRIDVAYDGNILFYIKFYDCRDLGIVMTGSYNARLDYSKYSEGNPYYTLGTRTANGAIGEFSYSEGVNNTSAGYASHAEGQNTTATNGIAAHSEGYYTNAYADGAHAEGWYTIATGYYSHAEGYWTKASNTSAHAEGSSTVAAGYDSHAGGTGTVATAYQTAIGQYNIATYNENTETPHDGHWTTTNAAFVIGNGSSDTNRSDAFTVDYSGNVWAAGGVTATTATFTDTVVLSKTRHGSVYGDYGPALVVGGTRTQAHMEIDARGIQAKSGATGGALLYLNYEGGNIYLGSSTVINATSKDIEHYTGNILLKTNNKGVFLTDHDSNLYGALYHNGSYLMIGATAAGNYHHAGYTYISSGWNGSAGNETIYISVPNSNSTSGSNTATNYGVWHKGNLVLTDITSSITLTKSTNCNSVTLNKAYRFGSLVYINFTVVANSGLAAGASVDVTYNGPAPYRGSDSRLGFAVYSTGVYTAWWNSATVIRCRYMASSAWSNSASCIFTGWYFAAGA